MDKTADQGTGISCDLFRNSLIPSCFPPPGPRSPCCSDPGFRSGPNSEHISLGLSPWV